jgi:hypothetical protein
MQYGDMDMRHEQDMQQGHGHAAWTCSMDTWTCGMGRTYSRDMAMQHGQAALTDNKDMKHGHATCTCSIQAHVSHLLSYVSTLDMVWWMSGCVPSIKYLYSSSMTQNCT